jgi:DNA polymerase-3 subunit epsilon
VLRCREEEAKEEVRFVRHSSIEVGHKERAGTFAALDFETADRGRDSACALGVVRVEGWRIVQRKVWLIRPPRPYFEFTYLHGISWPMVAGQPTFAEVWPEVWALLSQVEFVAAHNASFDRSILNACCRAAGLIPPELPFQCTMTLARRTWGIRPTRLPDVCAYLRLPLKHHDAGADAEACARIVLAALSGVSPLAR